MRVPREPSRAPTQGDARDQVCAHFQSLGVTASNAALGRPEERMGEGAYSSQGLLDISGGLISWINVVTRVERKDVGLLIYGIPASNLSRIGEIQLWSVRKKSLPIVGPIVDIRWESYIHLPQAFRLLDEDILLKQLMVRSLREDVEIRSQPSHGYWLLQVGRGDLLHLPSLEEWNCYQAIASVLGRVH